MKVMHWKDYAGNQWRELSCDSYKAFIELRQAYEKRGWKTWMNWFECSTAHWTLTMMKEV